MFTPAPRVFGCHRLFLAAAAAAAWVAVIGLAGCAALGPSSHGSVRAAVAPAPASPPRPTLAPPPGLAPAAVGLRTGTAMEQARVSLETATAALPVPDYLRAQPIDSVTRLLARAASVGRGRGEEPPAAAQKAYAAARVAVLRRRGLDAARDLALAAALAPEQPAVHALWGRALIEAGQTEEGIGHLRRAAALRPSDVATLLVLGRYDFEKKRWPEAAAGFAAALRAVDAAGSTTPPGAAAAQRAVAHYYLGAALERTGRDAAAAEAYRLAYLRLPRPGPTNRLWRELTFLARNRAAATVWIGDIAMRLGDQTAAVAAYSNALESLADDPEGSNNHKALLLRLLYAHLRAGRDEQALAAAAGLLSVNDPSHDDQTSQPATAGSTPTPAPRPLDPAALLGYLHAAGVAPAGLFSAVEGVYRRLDRPTALALAIADLLEPPAARPFLRDHLTHRPADRAVFERLLGDLVKSAEPADDLAAARLAVEVLERWPSAADPYAALLLEKTDDPERVLAALTGLTGRERRRSSAIYLHARALLALGRTQTAIARLRDLADRTDPPPAARTALAGILADRRRFDEALALLPADDSSDLDALALRAAILTRTGRTAEALAALSDAARRPDPELVLPRTRAAVQAQVGDSYAAERILLSTLDEHPRRESLYAQLFSLYHSDAFAPGEQRQKREALLRRASQTLPDARITLMQTALYYAGRGAGDAALKVADRLLERDPSDAEALELKLALLRRMDRAAEAEATLESLLAASPRQRRLWAVAERYHRGAGRFDQARSMAVRGLLLQPAGPLRDRRLARLYLRSGRASEALALLDPLIRRRGVEPRGLLPLVAEALPGDDPEARLAELERRARPLLRRISREDRSDVLLDWATALQTIDRQAESLPILQGILKQNPDHAPAANMLGYTLAERGERLDLAERLIRRALESLPDTPGYIDSLGWVYYKQGRYDRAIAELERAIGMPGGEEAVLLDHYGDALHRAGRTGEAVTAWRRAMDLLERGDPAERLGEERTLAERVRAKLAAAADGREVPTAALPGEPGGARAAGVSG